MHRETGNPARKIVEFAEKNGSDMIVVGGRGLGIMQLLDVPRRCWSDEVLAKLDIDKALLAKVYESPEVTGTITPAFAALTGLSAKTVVVGGAGDNAAAAIGTGIVEDGRAFTTIGTSGVVFAHTSKLSIDPKGRVHTFCCAVPGCWHAYRQKVQYGIPVGSKGTLLVKNALIVFVCLFATYWLSQFKGLPLILILLAFLIAVYSFICNKTVFGRRVYALGGNENATRLSGIKTKWVRFIVFVNMLGRQQDIDPQARSYDTGKIELFYVPAGTAVELYATTLHFAPCGIDGREFRCGVVLPRGTNEELPFAPAQAGEDRLLFAVNKWLIAHPDAGIEGAWNGLKDENLSID